MRPISEYRREFEVRVKTKGAKDWVGLPDVGFGVSQVLPVLVQSFYAPPNSIIIMEQPEIHLHPRAQANLADVLISAVKAREEGKDRNIQLIIETHSEHFLRRLQRRIAEEDELHELVVAYFANTDQHPASLEPLQIDLYGNIRNSLDIRVGHSIEGMKKLVATKGQIMLHTPQFCGKQLPDLPLIRKTELQNLVKPPPERPVE